MKNEIEEDDVVLCTVRRIEGNTVFLEVDGDGQGSMVFSEVSPGRIRNIRDFVVVNKKIVCKVLRIKDNHPELSLRRVTAKERDEVLEKHKKQKVLENMIKPILKEKTPQILEKIKEKYELSDFLDEARENPKILQKFIPKSKVPEMEKIFAEKKEKEKEAKQTIKLKSNASDGLEKIKSVLQTEKAQVSYLGSSKFSITIKSKDYKTANLELEKVIDEIKQKSKTLGLLFETLK